MPKYAVFNFLGTEKWQGHVETSMQVLAVQGSVWDEFKCYKGELPDITRVDQYTGIFLTGSHLSVNGSEPWIQATADWLLAFAHLQTTCKILGICFGCQLLAKALGAQVGCNPSGQFVLTVETVEATAALYNQDLYKGLAAQHSIDKKFKILQSHGEQVLALPEGAVLLATSATAPLEIWSYGDNMLALQGHCEFGPEQAMALIHAPLTANGRLTPEQSAASKQVLTSIPPDDAFLTDMIKLWWQHPLHQPTCAVDVAQQMHWQAASSVPPTETTHQMQSCIATLQLDDKGFAKAGGTEQLQKHDAQQLQPQQQQQQQDHQQQQDQQQQQQQQHQLQDHQQQQQQQQLEQQRQQKLQQLQEQEQQDQQQQQQPHLKSGQNEAAQLQCAHQQQQSKQQQHKGLQDQTACDDLQQQRRMLHHKADLLMKELAAVVRIEAASNASDFRLLQDMNTVVQQKYASMTKQVQQPQMQDLLVCQEAAEPVLKAIDQLLLSVKTIEGAVDKLELDSREMMLAMGLDKQPKPRLTF